MNQKILDVVMKFEKIADFDDDKLKEKNYAVDVRKQMLDMLKKFFVDETRDDFVTLFGIYCNHYIRCYLHKILPEEDFGVSELWDIVTDDNFQKYLSLIQHGIFEQDAQDFFDALEISDEYSLPHLYLFVFSADNFDSLEEPDKKEEFLKFMQEHYNKMNAGLREYVLGTKFIRESYNPALDENPLPYVKAVDKRQDHVFNIVKAMMSWYPAYKQLHDKFDAYTMMQYLKEGMEETFNIKLPELDEIPADESLSAKQRLEFQMASAVMKEKLEVLNTIFNPDESYYIDDDDDDNDYETWRDGDAVVFRVRYLDIPVKISNTGSFLLDQMEKLKLQDEKLKLQEKQQELVAGFTHRYKNLRATQLGNIAQSLLRMENEQEKNWGRALLLEQARKETMNKEVTMLTLHYEGNAVKLVNILIDSLSDDDEGVDISAVLQTTALNCFVEFFYAKKGDPPRMRARVKDLWSDLDEKKISFEREVIFDKRNCIDWMKENGFQLQIEMDERWQKISLQEDDYAEVFLRDIFLEMLKNFLKYGKVTEPVELKLYSDANTLKISMKNLIATKFVDDLKESTNKGLVTMDDTLKSLYEGKSLRIPEYCVNCVQSDEIFFIELKMPVEIFLKGENSK